MAMMADNWRERDFMCDASDVIRILKCTNESEWNIAKYFRDTYFFVPAGMEDPYTWTFDHPEHLHFLLYQAGKIDGYAHIQLWLDARAVVRIIVVDEARRDKGLGSAFLALLEE